MKSDNPYEDLNRLIKVNTFANHLQAADLPQSYLEFFSDADWKQIALTIGVKEPGEETKQQVRRELEERERIRVLYAHKLQEIRDHERRGKQRSKATV